MKSYLIFGAGGTGVGFLTAKAILSQAAPDASIVALVRSEKSAEKLQDLGVKVVIGDARDEIAVTKACGLAGESATIISSIGGEDDYLAHRTIIDCAEKSGLSRMIMVTSLGCGETWQHMSERARAAFGHALRIKSLAESWLQTSTLDYAIVRPAGLMDGAPTGKATLTQDVEVHGFVMRADVANHVYQLGMQAHLGGQIYALAELGLTPS